VTKTPDKCFLHPFTHFHFPSETHSKDYTASLYRIA
jgi:hypothetical protein